MHIYNETEFNRTVNASIVFFEHITQSDTNATEIENVKNRIKGALGHYSNPKMVTIQNGNEAIDEFYQNCLIIWDNLLQRQLSPQSTELLTKKNKIFQIIKDGKNKKIALIITRFLLEMRFSLMIYDAEITNDLIKEISILLNKHVKIQLNTPDYIIYKGLCIGLLSIAISGVGLFAAATLISSASFLLPFVTPIFALSFMTLTGLSYGIINDLFACRMNLAYFLFGHQPEQRSFSLSNNPTVQGIHWGILATGVISCIFGIIFSIVSASIGYCATSLLPFSLLAMLGLVMVAELVAQRHAHHFATHKTDLINRPIEEFLSNLDSTQAEALRFHLSNVEDLGKWHGNNSRNLIGYLGGFSIAITSMVLCSNLPQLFQTALFTQYIPLALAATMLIGVAFAMAYSIKNKDQVIEDAPYQIGSVAKDEDINNEGFTLTI